MPNQHDRNVALSIGVASMIPAVGATPAYLIDNADCAFYQAKNGGRNQVVQGTRIHSLQGLR